MSDREHKRIAGVMFSLRARLPARTARVLTLAERWLRPIDQLDYVIRRWLIPVPSEEGTRSMPHKEAWVARSGLSTDIIGRRLRAEYALERSLPVRLATLLREFEQRNNEAEAIAQGGYAGAA